jgi:hypothetical protein
MTRAEALQAAADLQAAREVLERYGWIKFDLGNRDDGFCALGALCEVSAGEASSPARLILAGHVANSDDGVGIATWNNVKHRCKADVLAAFDAAASLALSEAEVLP